MNKYTAKGFKLHTKNDEYMEKVNNSISIINDAFKNHNCYVSFSGGKDSTVLTHLALSIDKECNIWHWDYGDDLMPREIENEVINNLYDLGAVNIIVNKRDGLGSDTSSGYKQFFGQINQNKKLYGWDMGLIGIRRDESCNRKNKYVSYFQDDNCYPLLDWTYMDIWGYIVSNNLPYPGVYDVYSEVVGWDKSRFVTFFDSEFETLNCGLDGVLMSSFRN